MENTNNKKKMSPLLICAIVFGAAFVALIALLAVILIAISAIVIVFMLSIFSGKEPISAQSFESTAVSSGYTVQIDNNFGKKYDSINNAFIASDVEDDYQIAYLIADSKDGAKEIFQSFKSDLENIKDENKGYNHSSEASSSKYEKYELTTKDHFLYIARIENTIILVNAGIEDKAEAESFIKEIGY